MSYLNSLEGDDVVKWLKVLQQGKKLFKIYMMVYLIRFLIQCLEWIIERIVITLGIS